MVCSGEVRGGGYVLRARIFSFVHVSTLRRADPVVAPGAGRAPPCPENGGYALRAMPSEPREPNAEQNGDEAPGRTRASAQRVKLRPQDPFDLIRLLARSQSDPRKALAELVQNSLDAGAKRIEIQWFNEKGQRALRIADDGAGVFPELQREDALRRIAQTIGHSHKRDLTPSQRREELILGKYGIGLIGFWCVSEVLELRSRVAGGKAWVLRLFEDRAQGEVLTARPRLLDDLETYTEVTLRNVHDAVANKIRPPRLQAYLASELRGQLLERGATVRIRDRIARGMARKEFVVEPQPFLGRPLDDLVELEVPGFERARLELYIVGADEDRRGRVSLACGGANVLDDIAEIDGADQPRRPWSEGRLEGVIDFPDLHVAPASRRGFAHDEPVAAFLAALDGLERDLATRLAQEVVRREALRHESLAKEIRRAFVSVAEALPEYDFFDIRARTRDEGGVKGLGAAHGDSDELEVPFSDDGAHVADGAVVDADTGAGRALGDNPPTPLHGIDTGPGAGFDGARHVDSAPAAAEGEASEASTTRRPAADSSDTGSGAGSGSGTSNPSREPGRDLDPLLFSPGPLALLRVTPTRLRLKPLATRRLAAEALDADRRACIGKVRFAWSLDGPGELVADGANAAYTAHDGADEEQRATITVHATQDDTVLSASAAVVVERPDVTLRLQGIPEPHPVSDPGATWRSRFVRGRWEFNEAHRDFLAVAEVEAQRLRYLIHLFAKEVVLRNFGRPGDGEVLERMVEVLTRLGAAPRSASRAAVPRRRDG